MVIGGDQRNQVDANLGFDKLGLGIILYGYAVLLGACYLFAFWRPIGFDIFPYLGLKDYISAPLNRVAVLIASPAIFAALLFPASRNEDGKVTQKLYIWLVLFYSIFLLMDLAEGIYRFLKIEFYHSNELSLFIFVITLFLLGVGTAFYANRLPAQIAALVLLQSSGSMAAGYTDGKAVYAGAEQVHFLENKEVCEPGSAVLDWVFLGTFGSNTFFMNTADKRLCLTDQKNLRLVSRKIIEGI